MSLPVALGNVMGALEQAPIIVSLRGSVVAYPLVNTLHIVGVALLFGSIVPLDLRLLGWGRAAGSADALAKLLLPITITGLVIAIGAGLLLFATDARAYAGSTLFRLKMLLLLTATANALALRRIDWRDAAAPALPVGFAAVASLVLWMGVIILGRLVGYF